MHVYAAGFGDASLVFIVFVYVYVVIVNKHLTFLWITWIFVYGSRGCGIDNPTEGGRTGRRSQGKLLTGLARSSVYQSFAHNVSGGLYKSCPEGVVDKCGGAKIELDRRKNGRPLWARRHLRKTLSRKIDSYCQCVDNP